MSDQKSKKEGGDGAASLVHLFAPYPTPPQEQRKDSEQMKDSAPSSASNNEKHKSVMDSGTQESQRRYVESKTPKSSTRKGPNGGIVDRPPPPSNLSNKGVYLSSDRLPTSPLQSLFDNPAQSNNQDERTPLLCSQNSSTLESLFDRSSSTSFGDDLQTPKTGTRKVIEPVERKDRISSGNLPVLPAITEIPIHGEETNRKTPSRKRVFDFTVKDVKETLNHVANECAAPTTYIGSFMFLLYHVVFSLTMGATITRPHGTASMLGLFSKMAALGTMMGASVYWLSLRDVPALYPTLDLFAAPFLANIAIIVDEELFRDSSVSQEDNDPIFLATFTFLVALALFCSGTLLVLASVFKLANLGAFLPFPVLCGFFSAVGVLMWTLAFKVDTSGLTVSKVFLSGDKELIVNSLIHHFPSVIIAAIMKYLGPKNPFYVVLLVFSTIGMFYVIMLVFGISMEAMVEMKWFWRHSDLLYEPMAQTVGFPIWQTPAPFGWINMMVRGYIHWGAVVKSFDTIIALAFLYLIRCSLHGAALKKNVPMLSRVEKRKRESIRQESIASNGPPKRHRRKFSEAIDIENMAVDVSGAGGTEIAEIVTAKATTASLKDILLQYGKSQFVCGICGSFAITPCVAAAPTMFTLGAERLAPQIGSVILLSLFYLSNFELVGYIPKPAFSSLLVLAFIDMVTNWGIKSYRKTKEKMEWAVVPLIIVLAFVVGLLEAVFLGIGISTFLFVASFNRSGVVKYMANGVSIRSTIERSPKAARWLDTHADKIQVLVLQNYLFFGNASSILSYITSMFEDAPADVDPIFIQPCPKIVILDLTLVTGMDTSAVDAFSDILVICGNNDCKIFMSGCSTNLRQTMSLVGVKPEATTDRSKRKLRFFPTLDAAIGKAEDLLIEFESFDEDTAVSFSTAGDGFRQALSQIDEQHQVDFGKELLPLQEFTKVIDLDPGEVLYEDQILDRGLCFIEHGILKIERSSDATMSRAGGTFRGIMSGHNGTLNSMNARAASIGREIAKMKASGLDMRETRFRIARVGPGWVLGSLEAIGGEIPGNIIAVTPCRLHYVSYSTLEGIEEQNPAMILKLYKLISHLMAKRQEVTISQLGTLHSIMSAPALKKPASRANSYSNMQLIH